jgi:hypothetical protein
MWAHSDAVVTTYSGGIATGYVQMFPYDPARFAIFLPSHPNVDVFFTFADSNPIDYDYFVLHAATSTMVYRYQIGDLICRPLWGKCGSGGSALAYRAVSMAPNRYHAYQRWVHEQLSGPNAL